MKDDLTPENLPKMTQQPEQSRRPEQSEPAGSEKPSFEAALTDAEMQRAMEVLRQEQNLLVGTMAGFMAAVVSAAVWAAATVAAEYVLGWMAVVVGIATGLAVRLAGKGIDWIFGAVGAVMALLGCVLGNVFTIAWYVSVDTGTPIVDVLSQMDAPIVIELIMESFQVTDLLFYALAVYFGYRYAIRELSAEDFDRALGRTMPS